MPVRGVCLDIAGVLTDNGRLLPGAIEALVRLDAAGLPWRLLTNTSRRPHAALVAECRQLGLPVAPERLLAAPRVLAAVLRLRRLRPWLLMHPAVADEFAGLDRSAPNAVVVCDAGEGFDYRQLDAAFALLMTGAPLLAVGMNRYFQGPDRLQLDAGPFVRALEYAAGVQAEVVGKPGAEMFRRAAADMGLPASDVVMIGDDVAADIGGACAAGMTGVLVQTGKYRPADLAALPAGATVAADVLAAVGPLCAAGHADRG